MISDTFQTFKSENTSSHTRIHHFIQIIDSFHTTRLKASFQSSSCGIHIREQNQYKGGNLNEASLPCKGPGLTLLNLHFYSCISPCMYVTLNLKSSKPEILPESTSSLIQKITIEEETFLVLDLCEADSKMVLYM